METRSFRPTRWSMIRGADSPDPAVRLAALERLCAQYWYPLYAYLRRKGRSPELAADLVQGLFAKLLDRESLGGVTEGGGLFRNWLLMALQNHERDVHAAETAQKRGGGQPPVPIDAAEGERRLELQGAPDDDPAVAYERAWALATLAMARDLLEQELRAAGKGRLFEVLADSVTGEGDGRSRAELAEELGVTAVTLRVTLHRLRGRFRELLITVVADSLGDRSASGEELEALSAALGGETGSRKEIS